MNRISNEHGRATVCVATALLFLAGSASAQMSTRAGHASSSLKAPQSTLSTATTKVGAEKGDKVEIKRMPPPNKTAMVRTPEYTVNVQNTVPKISKRPREWALFEVKYETVAKWMDELTFNYYVMTKGKSDEGKEAFSFYSTALRCVDIPRGEHMSCVAIPPSLVERYGEPVAVALEIVGKDGTVLDSKTESIMPLPKEWWKDDKVRDNASVTQRKGLLERSKTPFALINADDYEVVQ